ncbi:MAG: hypothetical protein WC612_07700 [Bdellovibrionales bacterium]|jgi:hypothetical protein
MREFLDHGKFEVEAVKVFGDLLPHDSVRHITNMSYHAMQHPDPNCEFEISCGEHLLYMSGRNIKSRMKAAKAIVGRFQDISFAKDCSENLYANIRAGWRANFEECNQFSRRYAAELLGVIVSTGLSFRARHNTLKAG